MNWKGWFVTFLFCTTFFSICFLYPNRKALHLRKLARELVFSMHKCLFLSVTKIDWLYWSLLFVPFYALYICVGEKLFMLKSHLTILREDVSGKNRFIEWQNMALSQLDTRLVDLRQELEVLRRDNELYKREEESWRKTKELLKRKIREQQKMITHKPQRLRQEVVKQEIVTVVKKNKSESNLTKEKRDSSRMSDEASLDHTKHRSKSSHRSLPSIVNETKKGNSPEWERARLRLMERSKKLMRNRVCCSRSERDYRAPVTKSNGGKGRIMSERMTAACLSTVSESATEESLHSALSPHSEYNIHNPFNKSSSEMTVVHHGHGIDPAHGSRSASYSIRDGSGEEDRYSLAEFGDTKVRSYTEVFKKKVHVPTGGSGPRITIEGQRRWCF